MRALRFLPYSAPYRLLSAVARPRTNRVLFLSDSRRGFGGNLAYIRDELRRQQPDTEIIGIFKPSLRARRSFLDALRLPYFMATSAVIVLDDFYPLVYPLRIRRGTRLVQVWHAAGAFKRVGHSRAGLPGGPTPGSRIHRNYTAATVSSPGVRADYAEAYGIPVERVHALGVPRSDVFFDTGRLQRTRTSVRAALDVGPDVKLALFAPTFRGNGQLSAYAEESADWGSVASQLGPGWRVAVKQHPFTSRAASQLPSNVIDVSHGTEMNDLLAAADVLITDYSSVIFEFALLKRPVVFFVPDLEEYTTSRDFYRPFSEYAIGPVVTEPAELARTIAHATVDSAKLTAFLREFCGALDGHSSERIVRDLLIVDPLRAKPKRIDSAPARLMRRIGLDLVAAHTSRLVLTTVSTAMVVLPRRRKITMLSREADKPPIDFVLLRDAICAADERVHIVISSRTVPGGVLPKLGYALHLLVELYHVATSRVVVLDGYSFVASAARHGRGLTVVQIWHALGAMKKFGISILGRPEGRDPRLAKALRMHDRYDVVVTSAERCRPAYAEAFGTDPSRIMIASLPRVDRLRDPIARQRARARFARLYPDLGDRPIVLYAPTFRTPGSAARKPVDPLELTRALHAAGYTTITKLHPLVAPPEHAEIRTAPGMSTQDLMLVADVFVTDYSSAVFEAAVAGVPSYLLALDLDEYLVSRDFYLNYPDDLGLPFAASIDDLVDSIRRGDADDIQLRRVREDFTQLDADVDAAPLLASSLLSFMTEPERTR
ncbi:CDP-glycerol glycerophosphotransferase family protein [Microbacterium sp. LWS13-1.2]|uniref:CDP-glycerol glycerophosphotransferase family protein n=1 Tax=Microbacterium sp. LWS13-1.2 TaxID=3135264 RepID=A0AAU6SGF8_9MICO